MSDESNTPVRSLAVNPKEAPQKIRRAMTDNGPPKVSFIKIMIIININIKSLAFQTSTRNIDKITAITKTKIRTT